MFDIVGDMLDQYYSKYKDGEFLWPYGERPHVPLCALGDFAPRYGDAEVLFHLRRAEGGQEFAQIYEWIRGEPKRIVVPWTPCETGMAPPMLRQLLPAPE